MELVTFKRGIVHPHTILVVGIILAVWALIFWVLVSKGIIKKPSLLKTQKPTVELKTEYKNPFDKETQFVNPFDQTKNPFAVAK